MTDHQACVISDFLRISYHRSKELKYALGQIDYNRFEIGLFTSFKKGKRTKTEAASQNRRKRSIAIWESGRGVYFLDEILVLVLVVVGEPDNILDVWGYGSTWTVQAFYQVIYN